MREDQPIKFTILELFLDDNGHWNSEIVKQIQDKYDLHGNYWRDSINFDLIELSSGGLLKIVDTKVDEEGNYKKGFLLHKYLITDFGRTRASDACLVYV